MLFLSRLLRRSRCWLQCQTVKGLVVRIKLVLADVRPSMRGVLEAFLAARGLDPADVVWVQPSAHTTLVGFTDEGRSARSVGGVPDFGSVQSMSMGFGQ